MTKKIKKKAKKRACEYKLPNICQKTPDTQLVFRVFADVNLAKYWACQPCAEIVEKEMKARELIADYKSIASNKRLQQEVNIWDETLNDARKKKTLPKK